jgi:nucleotide-binding universal stress UspA family protein
MPTHRRSAHTAEASQVRPSLNSQADGLLVAVRETDRVHGVLHVAELLARRERINAHLVGVAERQKPLHPALAKDERDVIQENERHRLRVRMKRRLHQTIGRTVYWSTDAALGSLATVLAGEARHRTPRLILLVPNTTGASRRRDARAVVRTANAVDAPVLIVPPHQDVLPTRLLVATDFSESSKRAALAAMSVMGPRGRLTLVHIEPDSGSEARGRSRQRNASAQRIQRLFQEWRHELEEEAKGFARSFKPHSAVKETLLLRGEPAAVILEHAAQRKADLIVVGTRPLTKSGSMPRGSVTIAVLMGAGCAALVAHS